MYPHERSLVKRLEGKPFALLGINSDKDREKLKETLEKEKITWRSWWNGGSTSGPISTKWNVHAWPTIYVLDPKGCIRFKNVRGPNLDKAVDKLLAEAGVEVQKTVTPAEQYQALEQEFREAQQAFSSAYQDAKTPADRQKVFQEKYPRPDKYAGRYLELAVKNPKEPFAIDALLWILRQSQGGGRQNQEILPKALAQLARDHLDSPKLFQGLAALTYNNDDASLDLLRQALTRSKHREVQGQACFTLARRLKQEAQLARDLKDSSDRAKRMETWVGKAKVEKLAKADATQLEKEAEGLLERVVRDFGDLKHPYRGTFGQAAERVLFELRNLAIGKIAPDIQGQDLEGKVLKLSDYRGKVVVLDFWGHW